MWLSLLHVRVGYIVWIVVCRGSGSSRGVGGKGVVKVCLGGRGGIAVVVSVVVVVDAGVGMCVEVLRSVVIEAVVIVLGINAKDGRGRCA